MIGPQRRVISAAFSVESSAKVISLGQARVLGGRRGRQREHDQQRRRQRLEHSHARLLSRSQERRQIAARRIRDDTTSTHITMATMSRITVAASRSLNDRMVSHR